MRFFYYIITIQVLICINCNRNENVKLIHTYGKNLPVYLNKNHIKTTQHLVSLCIIENKENFYQFSGESAENKFYFGYNKFYLEGNPLIYYFQIRKGNKNTVICEVANIPKVKCRYFINDREVFCDNNNLISFPNLNGELSDSFKLKIIFIINNKNVTWDYTLKFNYIFDIDKLNKIGYNW